MGWGAQLGLDFVAVVDEELCQSDWEQDLYRAGLSAEIEARFLNVEQAAAALPDWEGNAERGFLLTRDIVTMRRLAEHGVLDALEINLGGLHAAPGRRRVLPYLFLSDAERDELRRLRRAELKVSAQDVPSARKIGLDELLETSQ